MPSKRKFHRRKIIIRVLSQEPYEVEDVAQIARDIIQGDCSGAWSIGNDEVLTGPQMAKALEDQASEPEFFGLDNKGNDLNCPGCGSQYTDDEVAKDPDLCDDCELDVQKHKCRPGDESICEPCQTGQGECAHVAKARAEKK